MDGHLLCLAKITLFACMNLNAPWYVAATNYVSNIAFLNGWHLIAAPVYISNSQMSYKETSVIYLECF